MFALARRSIAAASLRGYWPAVAAQASEEGWVGRLATHALAAAGYGVLLPIMPALVLVRRRTYGRALEAMVRDVVAGVEVPAAITRGARMLALAGMDRGEAEAMAERLLAGFLSSGRMRQDAAASAQEAGIAERIHPHC